VGGRGGRGLRGWERVWGVFEGLVGGGPRGRGGGGVGDFWWGGVGVGGRPVLTTRIQKKKTRGGLWFGGALLVGWGASFGARGGCGGGGFGWGWGGFGGWMFDFFFFFRLA